VIAAECDEVKAATLLKTNETFWNAIILLPRSLRDPGHPFIFAKSDLGHPPELSMENNELMNHNEFEQPHKAPNAPNHKHFFGAPMRDLSGDDYDQDDKGREA
jgi:hypothetical protein